MLKLDRNRKRLTIVHTTLHRVNFPRIRAQRRQLRYYFLRQCFAAHRCQHKSMVVFGNGPRQTKAPGRGDGLPKFVES